MYINSDDSGCVLGLVPLCDDAEGAFVSMRYETRPSPLELCQWGASLPTSMSAFHVRSTD